LPALYLKYGSSLRRIAFVARAFARLVSGRHLPLSTLFLLVDAPVPQARRLSPPFFDLTRGLPVNSVNGMENGLVPGPLIR
jgi:hypothetical protein